MYKGIYHFNIDKDERKKRKQRDEKVMEMEIENKKKTEKAERRSKLRTNDLIKNRWKIV